MMLGSLLTCSWFRRILVGDFPLTCRFCEVLLLVLVLLVVLGNLLLEDLRLRLHMVGFLLVRLLWVR